MYYITKKGGKFDEPSKQALISLPDGNYTIEKKKTKRSNEQNRYLHGVMLPLILNYFRSRSEEAKDLDIEDVKKWLGKQGFWGFKKFGKDLIPKGTSEMTVLEFMGAKEQVQQFFAERGLIIPDPEQEDFLDVENNLQT